MNLRSPFRREDLRELAVYLLDRGDEVVAMREIAAGERHPNVIGLRHDMDNTLAPCLELSEWEERHGYRASYYVLHDSPYWDSPDLPYVLDVIASRGHEIGIHVNAIATALEHGHADYVRVLERALERLRGWGHRITGAVAHGDSLCHAARFVNDEMFAECARPSYGEPDRTLSYRGVELELRPRPLSEFGLAYDSNWLPRAMYLSDSGGRWSDSFESICGRFPNPGGQLHVLVHPCWWMDAFPTVAEVTA